MMRATRQYIPLLVVHKIAKARRIHHSQTQLYAILLDVGSDGLDFDGLGGLVRGFDVLLWRVQAGVEERIDQC